MPGVNVIDADGAVQRFPDATTWHVDDRGQLHLKHGDKQVAAFAKDGWQGASTDDEVGPGVKRATLDDLLRELQALRRLLGDPIVVATRRGAARGTREGGH